jgi:hypothetical protein
MAQGVMRQRLELVGRPVTEVQGSRGAALERIAAACDLAHMEARATPHQRLECVRLEGREHRGLTLDPVKENAIADQSDLDGFGHASPLVARRQHVQKSLVVDHREGRSKGSEQILKAESIDRVLHTDTGVALREHRGRAPDVAHAAMEYRGGKPHCIEHGAATDGERIGLPIDMSRREVLENGLDAIVLVLDGLAARNNDDVSHQLHRRGVSDAIVGDTAGKLWPCKCHAFVDEHGETLRPGRSDRHQHLTKTRIAPIKKIAREMDRVVVFDRERLRERFRPRNVRFRVEHRRAPPIDASEQLQLSLRTHRRV